MSMIPTKHIDGDVSVGRNVAAGGDANIQGSMRVGHDLRVEGWLEARNIRGPEKGLYESPEALERAWPRPQEGWWALVGSGFPAEVWVSENGHWVDSGSQTDGVVVDNGGLESRVGDLEVSVEGIKSKNAQQDGELTKLREDLNRTSGSMTEYVHKQDIEDGNGQGLVPPVVNGTVPAWVLPHGETDTNFEPTYVLTTNEEGILSEDTKRRLGEEFVRQHDKGQSGGVAPLDRDRWIPIQYLHYITKLFNYNISGTNAEESAGIPMLNEIGKLDSSMLQTNVAGGVAGLNAQGELSSSVIPSQYVEVEDDTGHIPMEKLPIHWHTPWGKPFDTVGIPALNADGKLPYTYLITGGANQLMKLDEDGQVAMGYLGHITKLFNYNISGTNAEESAGIPMLNEIGKLDSSMLQTNVAGGVAGLNAQGELSSSVIPSQYVEVEDDTGHIPMEKIPALGEILYNDTDGLLGGDNYVNAARVFGDFDEQVLADNGIATNEYVNNTLDYAQKYADEAALAAARAEFDATWDELCKTYPREGHMVRIGSRNAEKGTYILSGVEMTLEEARTSVVFGRVNEATQMQAVAPKMKDLRVNFPPLSMAINVEYPFYYCEKLEVANCHNMMIKASFAGCRALHTINGLRNLNFANPNTLLHSWPLLEHLEITDLTKGFSLANQPKIKAECLRQIFTDSKNTAEIVITLHPTVFAHIVDGDEGWADLLDLAKSKNIQLATTE